MNKKIVTILTIIAAIFTLCGCGSKENNKEEVIKLKDVFISQLDDKYYRKGSDGRVYPCYDAILITTYNDYQCIKNSNIKFDEESGKYICTIEFKKIIE